MRMRVIGGIVAVAAAAGCTGCAAPLQPVGSDGTACIPTAAAGATYYFGDVVHNDSDLELRVGPVTIYGEDRMRLTDAWIVPLNGGTALESSTDAASDLGEERWSARSAADGFSIPAQSDANIVVAVSLTDGSDRGRADGIRVPYSAMVTGTAASTTRDLVVAPSCD